ncbi:MAG: hypothetical protein GEV04_01875 [Actinophytocola sp.]|nr:hypothetical protein [Actinophytocola sp.]
MNEARPESTEHPGDGNGAVTGNTPEELLADALRAKASQTGGNASVVASEPQIDRITPPSSADQRNSGKSNSQDIVLGWVVVLAVLLGLATGALIGLLTVI